VAGGIRTTHGEFGNRASAVWTAYNGEDNDDDVRMTRLMNSIEYRLADQN
jgi:hypothetical protein